MAIYHCSVKIIGRNSGRSSVAAAAYRAGENITNEYDGVEHDFTKKHRIEFTEIILPENAPKEYASRSALWNAVELAEKSKDAQLCREFELALPVELTLEQQIGLIERFTKEKLVSQGMIADIAIHNPPVTNDRHQPIDTSGKVTRDISQMRFLNPHAHILVTVRPMDADGKWQRKSEIEYLCKCGEEEKGFTATEFRTAKADGWEKQYKYTDGKKKIWLTAQEGKERGLERVNRSPKTTPYGRKNKVVEYWNSKDRIFEWRQHWEKVVNDEFIRMQSEIRIDHRSFADQGRAELSTLHMGPSAINLEKRAERELREGKSEAQVVRSDIGDINRQIKEHNKFIKELSVQIDQMVRKTKEIVSDIAKKLEGIRAKLIVNEYEKKVLSRILKMLVSDFNLNRDRLKKYEMTRDKVDKANAEAAKKIKKLKEQLAACSSLQVKKKDNLHSKIHELQEGIENREEYLRAIARMCGYDSDEKFQMSKKESEEECKESARVQKTLNQLEARADKLILEYKSEIMKIDSVYLEEVEKKRKVVRKELETAIQSDLQEKYSNEYRQDKYMEALCNIDNRLRVEGKKELGQSEQVHLNHKNSISQRHFNKRHHIS